MIKKIFTDDIYYSYEQSKPKKPLVVFIHGLGGVAKTGEAFLEFKDRSYDLLCFDLVGRGKSTYNQPISLKLWVDTIIELLKSLKVDNFYLFTHSFGSILGCELINSKKFNIINSLFTVPYNPFILPTDTLRKWVEEIYPHSVNYKTSKKDLEIIYNKIDKENAAQKFGINNFDIYYKDKDVMLLMNDQKFHDTYLLNSFKKANKYNLVVGDDDILIPFSSAKKLAKFKEKYLLILPTHHGMLRTHASVVNDYLNRLVTKPEWLK